MRYINVHIRIYMYRSHTLYNLNSSSITIVTTIITKPDLSIWRRYLRMSDLISTYVHQQSQSSTVVQSVVVLVHDPTNASSRLLSDVRVLTMDYASAHLSHTFTQVYLAYVGLIRELKANRKIQKQNLGRLHCKKLTQCLPIIVHRFITPVPSFEYQDNEQVLCQPMAEMSCFGSTSQETCLILDNCEWQQFLLNDYVPQQRLLVSPPPLSIRGTGNTAISRPMNVAARATSLSLAETCIHSLFSVMLHFSLLLSHAVAIAGWTLAQ